MSLLNIKKLLNKDSNKLRPIRRNIISEKEQILRGKISACWVINSIPDELEEFNPFDSNKTAKKVSIPVNSTIKDCVKYCNQAIKENPNGSYQYYMKGRFYVRLKKDKEAIKCFSKAIELDPQEADYYLERSNVKGLLGKIDDAIVDVKKAISIDPNCAIDLIAISIPEIQDSISAKELLDSLEMLKLNENNKHKK